MENVMHQPKWNKTSFKPGRKKTGGRQAGVRNKTTREMMEAIMDALEVVGSDGAGKDGVVGYMKMIAEKNPRALLPLIGRVMMLQEAEQKKAPLV
jgi:hypothetical protein